MWLYVLYLLKRCQQKKGTEKLTSVARRLCLAVTGTLPRLTLREEQAHK
jgi:hypothetical protein